ncbi:reverse transcriptase domain-containing protein [Tanacetum coccineum]
MVQHQYKTPNDERDSLLEETISSFIKEAHWMQKKSQNFVWRIKRNYDRTFKNQAYAIKTIEKNIGRIAESIHGRGVGTLPSFTETNPRGLAHAITTRSGLNYQPPKNPLEDSNGLQNVTTERQSEITKALADLGASISLMPYSIFLRLNLGDLKPTQMCIELANKTTQFPKGIAENVVVKIDKFLFPVDFVILDMEEGHRIPIILGRPFFATAHAMINVFNKKISFKVRDEIITFDLKKSMRFSPSDEDTCHSADIIDLSVINNIKEILPQKHDNSIELILDHLPAIHEDCNTPALFTGNFIDEEKPTPKLKELPSHLEYVFLDDNRELPVIISLLLSDQAKRHKISKAGIEVDKAKVVVIASLPYPTNVKGIRSFLGHARFYRRFIKDFSKISRPMTQLLMKDAKFDFSDECIKSFDILWDKLITSLVIIAPNWDLDFELTCDASDYAVGAVLGQRIEKKFRPIYYASKTMNNAQEHYTTTEMELLAVVYAFDKFRSYLIMSKTVVYTNHSALIYLFSKQDAKPRLIRWVLLLQEFTIEIKDKKRTENLAADHLSRLENLGLEELNKDTIQDNFKSLSEVWDMIDCENMRV